MRPSLLLVLLAAASLAQSLGSKIDDIAAKALADSGAPSVSVAVVRDGKIAYERAYGKARLDPPADARSDMHYAIGSVSKQFSDVAILLLAQDGKLSLDDRVSRYFPNLTRASEITIRQLLSHTSGYQDYYPQDYCPIVSSPAAGPVRMRTLADAERAHITAVLHETNGLVGGPRGAASQLGIAPSLPEDCLVQAEARVVQADNDWDIEG